MVVVVVVVVVVMVVMVQVQWLTCVVSGSVPKVAARCEVHFEAGHGRAGTTGWRYSGS